MGGDWKGFEVLSAFTPLSTSRMLNICINCLFTLYQNIDLLMHTPTEQRARFLENGLEWGLGQFL
jgi:hypothetical protein